MEEKHGEIAFTIKQHVGDLMFGRFNLKGAEKRMIDLWYEASELKAGIFLTMEQLDSTDKEAKELTRV